MSRATRSLSFESLEQKQMLAGDVVVNVVNGVLNLQGDELDNQVVVSAGEQPGTYNVGGLDNTRIIFGDGEPVNGVIVEGVRALAARLGDGDDVLRIMNATFPGNVNISTGAGDDRIVVGERLPMEPTVEGAVDIDANIKLGRNLIIRAGEGNDTVVVDNTVARGSLVVATGAGDDTVRIGRAAETQPAEDGEGDALASVGDRDPLMRPLVSFGRRAHVVLGEGADSLFVNSLRTGGFYADGGAGDDTMRLNGIHSSSIRVLGGRGEGADDVAIRDATTRVLFVALGDGDDSLSLGGVKAQLALLSGGAGEADTLTLLGENLIRHRRVAGFETITPSDPPAAEVSVAARRK